MKIAFFVDKLPPQYIGGYEERIWSFASGLARTHQVRVYTALSEPGPTTGNPLRLSAGPLLAPIHRSSRSFPHALLFSLGLLKRPTREWTPDVLVVEAIPYLHLYTMRRWLRDLPCPKVLDVVEAWAGYAPYQGVSARPSRWAVRELLALGLRWSDRALVAAQPTAVSLRRNFGFAATEVIPVGIHFRAPPGTPAERDRAAEYDFVTVGRLVPDKHQGDILEALARIRRRGWTGRAAIVGEGPLLPRLRALSRALGLEYQVDIPGRVSSEAKWSILSRTRIFVLASEREGQSVATLEALGCGLPAIVARPQHPEVFGVSDLVSAGLNGLYYPVGDIDGLADCMTQLLEEPAQRFAFSQRSTQVAREFDWDIVLQSLDTSLRSVARVP